MFYNSMNVDATFLHMQSADTYAESILNTYDLRKLTFLFNIHITPGFCVHLHTVLVSAACLHTLCVSTALIDDISDLAERGNARIERQTRQVRMVDRKEAGTCCEFSIIIISKAVQSQIITGTSFAVELLTTRNENIAANFGGLTLAFNGFIFECNHCFIM